MNIRKVGAALAATLILVAAKAAPAPEVVAPGVATFELEPAGSSLTFTAIQQSAKFESRFDTFTALVRFDPARPELGSITARIDLSSVHTGNAERDATLKGADWFNLSAWPEAEFNAAHIDRAKDGYTARGTLTLRGVTRPVTLQFRWTPDQGGRPARLIGSAALERLAFGVGQGDWRDTAYVGNAVEVLVDIRLRPVHGTVKSVKTTNNVPDAQ